MFKKLLKIVVAQSQLKNAKVFSEIDCTTLFYKFVIFIQYDMNCNFLASKVRKWFNENGGKVDREFAFRFRGKESSSFLRKFQVLISMILDNVSKEEVKLRLHQICFQFICLRRIISYSVRISNFDNNLLALMKHEGKLLFKACCLFDQRISPSLWTLCNVAPVHAEQTYHSYNFGLGCNCMEAREQKHQQIAKYAQNTTFQLRWPLIFRHEYIRLVYLRENGYDQTRYHKNNLSYLPEESDDICSDCSLHLKDGNCTLCSSLYMEKVKKALDKQR